MIETLARQPVLLLFAVLAAGYAVGRVRIAGISPGVAAVLFAGLAAGALDPRLQLPEVIGRLGLVLFVYATGVQSGPGFVSSLRRRGAADAAWTLTLLTLAAAGSLAVAGWLAATGDTGARAAGLFAGAFTNTPALATVVERLRATSAPGADALPVIAYSLAYPGGVLGVLMALALARLRWRRALAELARGGELETRTARVARAEACAEPVSQWTRARGLRVRFARLRRGDQVRVLSPAERLMPGDVVTVVGTASMVAAAIAHVGEPAEESLELDRSDLDFRRIFVSEPAVAGRTLADLRLFERFGALVTRVRRGDADLVPDGRTVLELGDRVRVVAPRARLPEVSRLFGDSVRALGEVDVVSFGLGAGLGLLLGLVPLPLPGGGQFALGLAGGPLMAGLLLGALGRTGPVVWQLPYGAGLTLRQLGLALFLAGVGTRAGWTFAEQAPTALPLVAGALALTFATASLALVAGRTLLRTPPGVLMGMVAGLHTQPSALAFAQEAAPDDSPSAGYAAVFPFATLGKILLATLLLRG